ncbi:MAG: hypothetical protein AAF318_18540 [Pseudomonadota bacterium]
MPLRIFVLMAALLGLSVPAAAGPLTNAFAQTAERAPLVLAHGDHWRGEHHYHDRRWRRGNPYRGNWHRGWDRPGHWRYRGERVKIIERPCRTRIVRRTKFGKVVKVIQHCRGRHHRRHRY